VRAATGLTSDQLIGWMGDFTLFVRGESVSELDGALVVETTDEAASARALEGLARLARSADDGTRVLGLDVAGEGFKLSSPDAPQPIYVYQREGRVVFAYGERAARDALAPPQRLADAGDFKAAADSLGDGYDVSTWLAVEPILKLIDDTPAADQAEWRQARRYLEPVSALIAGAKKDGDRVSSVLRITTP
jgi:hypothetical protein